MSTQNTRRFYVNLDNLRQARDAPNRGSEVWFFFYRILGFAYF